jgi:16S rRNA (uracil1498-N3)-methyltransferase
MLLFYTSDISGSTHVLDEQESKHVTRVLRLKRGDMVHLTDGNGNIYESEISNDSNKRCELTIVNVIQGFGKRRVPVHIAIAPTKNINRFEWFLEKSTELGIDQITPIFCERSERTMIKPDRLKKVMVAAMKQSLKAYLPVLNPAVRFEKFLASMDAEQKFIAYIDDSIADHLKDKAVKHRGAIVLVGPEGDFSPGELKLALENGYIPISLGKNRLRTETAGIAACHILNLVNDQ